MQKINDENDLRHDPHEANNLAAVQVKRASDMKKQLLQWQRTLPDVKELR